MEVIATMLWYVQEGKSALMLVCERGHISLLLTVLDCQAEVNFQHEVPFIKSHFNLYLRNLLVVIYREQERLLLP